MRQAAKDEADWQRTHGMLYAPPRGVSPARRATSDSDAPTTGAAGGAGGVTRAHAQTLMAQLAAEDAQYGRRA